MRHSGPKLIKLAIEMHLCGYVIFVTFLQHTLIPWLQFKNSFGHIYTYHNKLSAELTKIILAFAHEKQFKETIRSNLYICSGILAFMIFIPLVPLGRILGYYCAVCKASPSC